MSTESNTDSSTATTTSDNPLADTGSTQVATETVEAPDVEADAESVEESAEESAEPETDSGSETSADTDASQAEADADDEAATESTESASSPETDTPSVESEEGFIVDSSTHNPAFEIEAEVGPLLDFLDKATPLVSEVCLQMAQDELAIIVVDPANVAMVDARLSPTVFEDYQLDDEGIVGIELKADSGLGLYDALNQFSNGTEVSIELSPNSANIVVTGDGLELSISTIDPDTIRDTPNLPDFDEMLDVSVEMATSDFTEAISAIDLVSDHVEIEATASSVVFRGDGTTDSVEMTLDATDLFAADFEPGCSIYAMEYLKEIKRALDADDIHTRFGENVPIVFSEEFAEVDDETNGESTFMLAPRIQEN